MRGSDLCNLCCSDLICPTCETLTFHPVSYEDGDARGWRANAFDTIYKYVYTYIICTWYILRIDMLVLSSQRSRSHI